MKLYLLVFAPALTIAFLSSAFIPDKQTQPTPTLKTDSVSANGLTFHYQEAGSGQPLILIHGSVSDYREWSDQMEALSKHYRVIAYSRRYHWPNAAPDSTADASVEMQLNDLVGILKALRIDKAHIVGHSFGGVLALQLALRYPRMVKTLVLAEPGVATVLEKSPQNDSALAGGQETRAVMKDAFDSGDAETIVKTYAGRVAKGSYEKATQEHRRMLLQNVAAFRLDYEAPRLPFTCADAGKIAVPVLVLSGTNSSRGLQRIAEGTAQCIKGAKLLKLANATHWMPSDEPKAFNEAVLTFLKQINK